MADNQDEWTHSELDREFEIVTFEHNDCLVRRKSDGATGRVTYSGRKYYHFRED